MNFTNSDVLFLTYYDVAFFEDSSKKKNNLLINDAK